MNKKKSLLFVIMVFILVPKFTYAGCGIRVPPLEDRVKKAYAIFTGEVISVEAVKSEDKRFDHKARVKVSKVFKGEIGQVVVDVYFLFVGPEQVNGFDNCVENSYDLKPAKKDILFYVADFNGKMFTSGEWGTDAAIVSRDEIRKIPKLLKKENQEK